MKPDFSPLLSDTGAKALFTAFDKADKQLRFVGGCVRDVIMARPVGDLDFATTATPEQTKRILEEAGIKAIPTGIAHGTVTAHIDGRNFEITTLRRDVTTDGRHAEVAFTDDWQQDAERRDFTINAMSLDQNGVLYDPFNGQADIANKHLRFIGNADKRIQEDYLRILRYFRFAAQFDWPLDDKVTLEILQKYATSLTSLSRERIQNELFKLLTIHHPLPVLQKMHDYHILKPLFAFSPQPVKDISDPFLRLWRCGPPDGEWLNDVIVPSRNQTKRINDYARLVERAEWPLHKKLYYFGATATKDWVCLSGKDNLTDAIDKWEKPAFPVKAADLPQLSGKELGMALKRIEEYWVNQNFKPSKEKLLSL
jgi:poly(A) polymerase